MVSVDGVGIFGVGIFLFAMGAESTRLVRQINYNEIMGMVGAGHMGQA